ncbi:hypothetical protein BAUCODRAFT_30760 [Baudoinia panamericana UAMH 10762]|uniref:Uncharacterized protein n=1 Tax=Baudoinia panamericana (strain UAMH 10762) TaxID=717646 RepID=M2N833_BAUPA|nr:uncharacterized protein BAUCODRAFT_30760 [Baudoinia panamericana UAMH 10762]EMD00284.1 hypothetical protein BAUCODRAFT_30760 [Baudoinia panamericana UAMH 10762]
MGKADFPSKSLGRKTTIKTANIPHPTSLRSAHMVRTAPFWIRQWNREGWLLTMLTLQASESEKELVGQAVRHLAEAYACWI